MKHLRWGSWVLGCLAVSSSLCFGQGAARKVNLLFSPLALPEATLTKSDFVYDKGVPVLFYSGMIVPKVRLNFSQKDNAHALTLGGSRCTIEFDGRDRFRLKAGKKDLPLSRTRMGLAGPVLEIGKGQKHRLGFPRAFTYLQKGAIYLRSGCVQSGTLGGQTIALYDENCDGRYTRKDDCIRIGARGDANAFAPISDFVATTSTVYKIGSIAADGSAIAVARHTGDIGKVTLACPGKGVEVHVAIASADAKMSFGAAARNQTLTVIPGKYRLLYGFLFEPKSRRVLAMVLGGKMPPVVVPKYVVPKPPPKAKAKPPAKGKPAPKVKPAPKPQPPKPAAMPIGEGMQLDFTYKKKDGKIVVIGPVVPKGKLGEEYVGMAIGIRAYVLKERKSPDPKKKLRPTKVEIGRFTTAEDLKPAEHPFDMPTVDKKPLKGKCALLLQGSVPGFGTVSGSRPIDL